MNITLNELRINFEKKSNRSLSMPTAGTLIWLIICVSGFFSSHHNAAFVMLFGTGMIFPLALIIGKFRKEIMFDPNPLNRLIGARVLMVNLLWAVHLPLLIRGTDFFPLSLGIGLGIHWVIYSWIIQHYVVLIHAVMRTILVVTVWFLFPDYRITAIASVLLTYTISIFLMNIRKIEVFQDTALEANTV